MARIILKVSEKEIYLKLPLGFWECSSSAKPIVKGTSNKSSNRMAYHCLHWLEVEEITLTRKVSF